MNTSKHITAAYLEHKLLPKLKFPEDNAAHSILMALHEEVKKIPASDKQIDEEINQDLIQLLEDSINKLKEAAPQEAIDIKLKSILIRRLKTLQAYLINQKAYKDLGIHYRDILSHDSSPNAAKKYFEPATPEYLDPAAITEETVQLISLVYISGISPNPYGHMLLKIGDLGYLHIYDLLKPPLFIPKDKFGEFLRESGQILLGIQDLYVPDMKAVRQELKQSSQTKWRIKNAALLLEKPPFRR